MPSDVELVVQLTVSGTSSSWYCMLWRSLRVIFQRLRSIVPYYRLARIPSLSTLHDAKEWTDSCLFRLWWCGLRCLDPNTTIYIEEIVFLPWLDVSRAWKRWWSATESMDWPREVIRRSQSLVVFVSNVLTGVTRSEPGRDTATISTLRASLVRRCRILSNGKVGRRIQTHSRKKTATVPLAQMVDFIELRNLIQMKEVTMFSISSL